MRMRIGRKKDKEGVRRKLPKLPMPKPKRTNRAEKWTNMEIGMEEEIHGEENRSEK